MEDSGKEKSKNRGTTEQRIAIVTVVVVVVLVIFAIILTINEEVNGGHPNSDLEIVETPPIATLS